MKRVLHVVGGMSRGGIETWLMHLLRSMDRERVQMDFLVHTNEPCAYDAEVRMLGSQIVPCPWPHRPLRYANELRKILDKNGPYDVVHSHVHHFTGWILRVAQQAGVPMRIAHSHNDTRGQDRQAGWTRHLYLRAMEFWLRRHATVRVAASQEAGVCLFGSSPWRVLYCGIDLAPFRTPVDPHEIRGELGLPSNAFVVGHVGRFMEQKNHGFLIRIAAELAKREPNLHVLLVGDGPLRESAQKQVADAGLSNCVHFLGLRPDVPRVMGALDVFLLPSLFEGLPLVGMEVQAAGIPLVLTDTITREVEIIPELVRRCALEQSPAAWADAVLAMRGTRCPGSQALARAEQSPFNIQRGVQELEHLYVA